SAWARFGASADHLDVARWSACVLRRKVSCHARKMLCGKTIDHRVELLLSVGSAAPDLTQLRDLVSIVRLRLHERDRATLDLMRAGLVANSDIARVRCLSIRAVERSRARIRDCFREYFHDCVGEGFI